MEKVIKEGIEDNLAKGLEQQVSAIEQELKNIIEEIKKELKKIDDINVIDLIQKSGGQRLLSQLEERYKSKYDKVKKLEEENTIKLINSIVKLYFLTEEFFSIIGVIQKPRFLMTYIDNGFYIRKDFEKELLQDSFNSVFFNKESGTEGFGLRFNSTYIINKLKKSLEENEIERQNAKKLYEHYQTFTAPYRKYEKRSINTTGWQMNEGVAREAFERHLENLHRQFVTSKEIIEFQKCRMESVGRRWVMYRYASGSDPYFTGPDTLLSQVKAENASLVSNIDTVLNTALFIVKKGQEINIEDMKQLLKTKGENEINTFSKKIWEGLSEKVKKDIQKEFEKNLGLKNGSSYSNDDKTIYFRAEIKNKKT